MAVSVTRGQLENDRQGVNVLARMLADPFATAVTSPLALTVATPASDDVQVKVRLVFVFPFARRLAVSWTV